MSFDPRPYCERIAAVKPDRFKFVRVLEGSWVADVPGGHLWSDSDSDHLWAFIGPLADELTVRPSDVFDAAVSVFARNRRQYGDKGTPQPTLLEATFEAVASRLETLAKEETT